MTPNQIYTQPKAHLRPQAPSGVERNDDDDDDDDDHDDHDDDDDDDDDDDVDDDEGTSPHLWQ